MILCLPCREELNIVDAPHEITEYSLCPRCTKLRILYEVDITDAEIGKARPAVSEAPSFGQIQEKKSRKRAK